MATIQALINTITQDDDLTIDDKIKALLTFGMERVGMAMGIISHVDGTRYTVKYCTNADLISEVYQLGNTYCSITLKLETARVLSVPQFSVSEYFRHPAYAAFQLESYIGIPIIVNGNRYGTLNYTKSDPHKAFSETDYTIMTALSDSIGQLLGQKAT